MTDLDPHLHDSFEALKSDVSARIRTGPQERARRAMHVAAAAHAVAAPAHLWRNLATVAASALLALLVANALLSHHPAPAQLSNTQLASQYLHTAESDLQSAKTSSNPGPLLAQAHDALAKAKPLLPKNHSDPLWKAWNTDSKEVEHELSSGTSSSDKSTSSPEQSVAPTSRSHEDGSSSTASTEDGSSGSGHDN